MRVTVNGEERELRDGATVQELLALLGTAQSGIAVACNENVVRRSAYARHRLAQGDRVEIIKAVAGG
jgi:sulfur carrier protein